jgi:hypothetical protein
MARLYRGVTLSLHTHLLLTFLTEFEILLISIKGLSIKPNHSSVSFENVYNFRKCVKYEK